ncbi:4-hydroxy-4-methyl-2-oxoglutarate aldolase [Cognatiyoonia koreensis]|uniref:Putative 4-hydroxy-4-methyl-2-oxoglutarate aldolase n=1 Tax=Cognatiyoonia koreensis TaxID=364200 RepID=A0A1I0QXA0_9RHOB|nr:aldolase [Cognatiyoonia koreensis]SEW32441.1 4-hydroxy-4-methyl-2-oxoglutarate aldolase [Cognatiyoonia koreensis]
MIEDPRLLSIREGFARPTAKQVAAFRDVPTGFVCDAMDGRGGMGTAISPLLDAHIVGCAIVAENGPEGNLATLGAVHIMQAGDVIIAAMRGGQTVAAAGDMVLAMIRNKGGAGFVTDGPMRDLTGIRDVGLPAWCSGLNPNSPYATGPGRVGYGASVGGQTVESGDIIVADENGVVVVPHAQIDTVIARLDAVRAAEISLEAKVKAGFSEQAKIVEMLADGRAVIED